MSATFILTDDLGSRPRRELATIACILIVLYLFWPMVYFAQGCVRNVHVDGDLQGLQQAEVSFGLQPTCIWRYPCAEQPCIASAVCVERDYHRFVCQCDEVRKNGF